MKRKLGGLDSRLVSYHKALGTELSPSLRVVF